MRGDRGQTIVEFVGMAPVVLATVALLWQGALIGYTFSLAGNAADEAVRAGTVASPTSTRQEKCRDAVDEHLPSGWDHDTDCWADNDIVKAEVTLDMPVLFPGFDVDIDITGDASAVRES